MLLGPSDDVFGAHGEVVSIFGASRSAAGEETSRSMYAAILQLRMQWGVEWTCTWIVQMVEKVSRAWVYSVVLPMGNHIAGSALRSELKYHRFWGRSHIVAVVVALFPER